MVECSGLENRQAGQPRLGGSNPHPSLQVVVDSRSLNPSVLARVWREQPTLVEALRFVSSANRAPRALSRPDRSGCAGTDAAHVRFRVAKQQLLPCWLLRSGFVLRRSPGATYEGFRILPEASVTHGGSNVRVGSFPTQSE
jgi:hypothetical protein